MKSKLTKNTLYLSHFATDLCASLLTPILPILTQKLNIDIAQVSLIMSLSYIGSSFLQPIFGNIADNLKKSWLIIAGMICTCVFAGFIGYTNNVLAFALFVIIINLGEGLYHPQATILSNIISKNDNKGNTMGLYIASGLIGFSLGPILAGYLSNKYGIINLKYISILAVFVILFVGIILKNVTYQINTNKSTSNLFKALFHIFKNRSILSLMLLSISRPLILITFCVYMPFLLSDKNLNSYHIGILICFFQLFGALGAFVGGKLYDKTNKIILFAISLITTSVLVISALLIFNQNMYVSLGLYMGASFMININSGINILLAQNIDENQKGMLGGILNGFNWWIAGFSLSAIGIMMNKFGIINVLILLGLIPFISSYLLIHLKKND